MPEVNYKELNNYLEKIEKNRTSKDFAPVYLIYGEELLCNTTLEDLLTALIPPGKKGLNYDRLDGTSENIKEAIERMNTYSLLSGKKVVAICDSKIFYSKQDEIKLLEKARESFDSEDMKKAAKYLLSFLGILNLSFSDVTEENRGRTLKLDPGKFAGGEWLDKIIKHCIENHLTIPSEVDNAVLLQKAIEKGFPKGNHLIITTDMVDKRRKLYKIIQKKAIIINCSVPKGARMADKMAQEAVIIDQMEVMLDQFGKIMDKGAYQAMYELTGFDLRTFSENLKKLINYVGDRKKITKKDVEDVLKRTKKDPIYEFTNAISDRNIEKALFFLNSLLSDNLHPLQILAAFTNQIRKLLLVRGFAESPHGSSWHSGIQYGPFKTKIMPAIQIYDTEVLDQLEEWDAMLSKNVGTEKPGPKKEGRKKKGRLDTDLIIARSLQNPYPVYRMLLKSEKFTTNELIVALEKLSEADLRMKSTKQRPRIVLEEAVLRICG